MGSLRSLHKEGTRRMYPWEVSARTPLRKAMRNKWESTGGIKTSLLLSEGYAPSNGAPSRVYFTKNGLVMICFENGDETLITDDVTCYESSLRWWGHDPAEIISILNEVQA